MANRGTKTKKRVKTLRDKLEECIEPQYGLLAKLVSYHVLSLEEFWKIQSNGSESDSCEQCVELLNCMQCKTPNDFEQFLDALIEEEQKHVVNYISQKARRYRSDHSEFYNWPLEQFHRNRIIKNWDQLVDWIECDSKLISVLFSHHCINHRQVEIIMENLTSSGRTEKLLAMLLRRSIRDYNVFVEFFKESEDTSYLARLFEEKALVETVDTTIASFSAEPVSEVEEKIVTRFRTSEQLRGLIRRLIHRDCHPNTELAAMKVGRGIRCFFFCGTPDALQSLYISLNNGSLITTMQWIFQQLFGCEESIFVVKITGRMSLNEQMKRVAEFCTDIGSVNSNELSEAAMSGFKKPFMLPCEVLKPILLQVAVKLFKRSQVRLVVPRPGVTSILQVVVNVFKRNQLRQLVPRPDVTSMHTISCVCKDWFQIITGRKELQRKLKFTFTKSTVIPTELLKAAVLLRHRLSDQPMTSRDADVTVLKTMASVCHRWMMAIGGSGDLKRVKRLFHYNAQLLVTLRKPPPDNDGRPRYVYGVVMLENFVYVVYYKYNKVEVFDCEDCYKKGKDIEVEGMIAPQDMVGSNVTSQLFISDWNIFIRRVDLKTGVSDVFVKLDDVSYGWLSLVENLLLVTSRDSLLMYDTHSGEKIKKIPYTEDWKEHVVYHVIESNRDSFFVSHGVRDNKSTVSEIDCEGREIRVFNNEQQLHCNYLALDSVGRLLVTDYAVVLLDEHLKFKRILIDNKRLDNSRPLTLKYNKNNNKLAVGLYNGHVKIFECNKCYCR